MNVQERVLVHPGVHLFHTLIKPKKVNQRMLSQRMGLSKMGLYKILRGHTKVSPDIAWKFEVLLGVSANELIEQQAEYDLWEAKQALEQCHSWSAAPLVVSPQMDLAMS